MLGEKQGSAQFGENLERCKRVKMSDLDSVGQSKELIESSQHQKLPTMLNPAIISFDLNSQIHEPNTSASIDRGGAFDKSKGFNWDLNVDDKTNSPNEERFFPFKNCEHLRSGDVSECGSTTGGPSEDKDPMKVWKEMKQNGFLSSSHVSIPVLKPRGRKSKTDVLKNKMELAKKEQVDRFAKIAAPCGLLKELNPGIINHVRNRKQVHSIIEALVRLEKNENNQGVGKQAFKDGYVSGLRMPQLGVSHNKSSSTLSMSQRRGGTLHLSPDQRAGEGYSKRVEKFFSDESSCPLQKKQVREDDVLALKLASSTAIAPENISSLSNEEFVNLDSISSLSIKGASVAFHWLELLQQDINGRLAALRCSKERVRSVISTELPFLMPREFIDSQEKDPHVRRNISDGCSIIENADAHHAKWTALFDQMDEALSEEEKQLELWLRQVEEMQLQCEKGLNQFPSHPIYGSLRPGTSGNDHRLEEDDKSERELAVRAAAASIYSTCNLLSSKPNLPCF